MRFVFILICLFVLDNWIIIPLIPYLAAWMMIPAAETTTQKLEMWGQPINTETIGEHVRSQAMQPSVDKSTQRMMGCLSAGCLTSIGITVLGLGLLTILVRLSNRAIDYAEAPVSGLTLAWGHWYDPMPLLVLSMVLIILIPLLLWLYPFMIGKERKEALPSWVRITATIVWVIATGVFMYCFIKAFIYGGTSSWFDYLNQRRGIHCNHWH